MLTMEWVHPFHVEHNLFYAEIFGNISSPMVSELMSDIPHQLSNLNLTASEIECCHWFKYKVS